MSALINPTFWLIVAFTAYSLLRGRRLPLPWLGAAWAPVIVAGIVAMAATNAAARALIGHAVPGDFVQEVAAAHSFATEGTLYTADVNADVRAGLTADPPAIPGWLPDMCRGWLERRQRIGRNLLVAQAHPPALLLSFAPIIRTWGASAAYWGLTVATVLAAVMASQLLLRTFSPDVSAGTRVLAAAVMLSWQPVLASIRDGQVSVLVGALAVLAWHQARAGHYTRGGLAAGVSATLKLYPALLLAAFATRRRAGGLVTALTVCGAGVVAVTLVAGPDVWRQYSSSARTIAGAFSTAPHNLGVVARLSALTPDAALPFAYALAAGLMLAASAAAVRRGRMNPDNPRGLDLDFALVMTLAVLLSPVAWHHYLFLLVQPMALTLVLAVESGRRAPLVCWGLGALVLSLPDDVIRTVWAWLPPWDRGVRLASPGLVILSLWITLLRLRAAGPLGAFIRPTTPLAVSAGRS